MPDFEDFNIWQEIDEQEIIVNKATTVSLRFQGSGEELIIQVGNSEFIETVCTL